MPTTYIYVFKWFKVSKKTRKTSEVCKKPVLQNKTGGCFLLTHNSVRLVLGRAYRGLTGGFLLLRHFSVAIPGSPHVCFILALILIFMFLR